MSELLNFLIEKNVELTLDRTNSTELELLAYDTIKELRHELKKLREERDKLVECVKFYADKDHWSPESAQRCSSMLGDDHEDVSPALKNGFLAGRRARQTLKDIGEV